jgi:hypothetical protein
VNSTKIAQSGEVTSLVNSTKIVQSLER